MVTGRTLQDVILDSIHGLEAQFQHLPALVSERLNSVGDAILHPKDNLRRISGFCAQSLSDGMQQLRHGVGQSLASVSSSASRNLYSLQESMVKEAASLPAELHHVSEILESWLHEVVQKAVHWPVARWPLYLYMAGAMTCLLLSAMCHLLGSSSHGLFKYVWRLDYAGKPIRWCCLIHSHIVWDCWWPPHSQRHRRLVEQSYKSAACITFNKRHL